MIGGRVEFCADCAHMMIPRSTRGADLLDFLYSRCKCAVSGKEISPGANASRCCSFVPVFETEVYATPQKRGAQ